MVRMQFVFLFLACTVFQEISIEMDIKIVNVIIKNKSATVFHSLYSHRPIERLSCTQNVQNFAIKTLTHGSWFHLMFEHVDVISMVNKSTGLGQLLLIC